MHQSPANINNFMKRNVGNLLKGKKVLVAVESSPESEAIVTTSPHDEARLNDAASKPGEVRMIVVDTTAMTAASRR
jgi:hypothetical protein